MKTIKFDHFYNDCRYYPGLADKDDDTTCTHSDNPNNGVEACAPERCPFVLQIVRDNGLLDCDVVVNQQIN